MSIISLPPSTLPHSNSALDDSPGDKSSPASQAIAEVASLSSQRIMEMTRSDLVEVIRKVRLGHLRPGVLEQLSRMDGTTLRRLVFATRRYCRGQALLRDREGAQPGTGRCPR